MKLLVQSDDYGMSYGTAYGINQGIEHGIITCAGLMTNFESSVLAAELAKQHQEACYGIDLNVVTGNPISHPSIVPSLVDEHGFFIRAGIHMKLAAEKLKAKGVPNEEINCYKLFEEDPFCYDELFLEYEVQIKKFITLMGKKPGYIQGHAITTPNITKVHEALSQKYSIPLGRNTQKSNDVVEIPSWYRQNLFTLHDQIKVDVTQYVLEQLDAVQNNEYVCIVCHAGYIDADLIRLSSFTGIRIKDLEMCLAQEIKDRIKKDKIHLITYRDLKGFYGSSGEENGSYGKD